MSDSTAKCVRQHEGPSALSQIGGPNMALKNWRTRLPDLLVTAGRLEKVAVVKSKPALT